MKLLKEKTEIVLIQRNMIAIVLVPDSGIFIFQMSALFNLTTDN
jgi:hypothetical protein